ncbi:hypothetical protein [Phenylobacterium sp.]|uniref:hypothetical protein n=1 Tax=Phenylobacterium sp. TaxID=1871053 RepID=UPI0035B2A11E
MRPLPLDQGAPLAAHERYPGSRLELVCGSCTWSRTYRPARIVERLQARRLGDRQTAIAAIAHLVQWPCPGCRRMRWGSRLVAP